VKAKNQLSQNLQSHYMGVLVFAFTPFTPSRPSRLHALHFSFFLSIKPLINYNKYNNKYK
jgi:hypothetical protein